MRKNASDSWKYSANPITREPPQNVANIKDMLDEALSMDIHAMRSSIHTTLCGHPSSLIFNRDIYFEYPSYCLFARYKRV